MATNYRDSEQKRRYPDAPRSDTIEAGNSFEDFVCDALAAEGITLRTYRSASRQLGVGESRAGFEIKLDAPSASTGRLSIEVAERTRNEQGRPWTQSGILRNDNTWLYIQGNPKFFWVFHKPTLVEYYRARKPKVDEKFGTVRTFYLSWNEADRLGKRIGELPEGHTAAAPVEPQVIKSDGGHLLHCARCNGFTRLVDGAPEQPRYWRRECGHGWIPKDDAWLARQHEKKAP